MHSTHVQDCLRKTFLRKKEKHPVENKTHRLLKWAGKLVINFFLLYLLIHLSIVYVTLVR